MWLRFDDLTDDELYFLKSKLIYKDLSIQYQYHTAKKNRYMWEKDYSKWSEHVEKLKNSINQTLLIKKDNNFYTYSGLKDSLFKNLNFYGIQYTYTNNIKYPEFEKFPYNVHYKTHELHDYQEESVSILLKNPHASIELPTGSGKQLILQTLVKRSGLPALIVVPFRSIAHQFIDEFSKAFGKKYVGLYGDGKKDYNKEIVIGISDSISSIKEDSEAYKKISEKQVLIFDESHLVGAPTVSSIASGIGQNMPYRWSVSATQLRIDGKDLLLEGIIGNIVYTKSFKELVDKKYLSGLHFHVYKVHSSSNYVSSNPGNMVRKHYLLNEHLLLIAAKIASLKYEQQESTLILIDELKQAEILKNYLTAPFEFAYSESDVTKQVENFNSKKNLILIGTKAIITGTNTKPTQNIILLMMGKSPTKFKQALGRGTRTFPGKTHCNVIDFNVENVNICNKHFENRLALYQELSDNIKFHDLTNRI